MDTSKTRRLIISNMTWSSANVGIRYTGGFLVTAFIASQYSPSEFGIYQIVLSYYSIFETINLLSPTHLKNYLSQHPHKINEVYGSWRITTLGAAVLISLACFIIWASSGFKLIYGLILIVALRVFARIDQVVTTIHEQKKKIYLSQRNQIGQQLLFNTLRFLVAFFKGSLTWLVSSTLVQGIVTNTLQRISLGVYPVRYKPVYDWKLTAYLIHGCKLVSLVTFLKVMQTRIYAVIMPSLMTPDMFGNFSLVMRLIDPVLTFPTIFIGVNYSLLAQTRVNNPPIFRKRFLKVAVLCLSMALVASVLIWLIDVRFLTSWFGASYSVALENFRYSGFVVSSTVLFQVAVHYDYLQIRYLKVLYKTMSSILITAGLMYLFRDQLTIPSAMLIVSSSSAVSLIFVESLYFIAGAKKLNKDNASC